MSESIDTQRMCTCHQRASAFPQCIGVCIYWMHGGDMYIQWTCWDQALNYKRGYLHLEVNSCW